MNAAGQQAFFENAGFIDDGSDTPISLRATLVSISAGDTIRIFRSGDNPVVRANTGTLAAEVLWEVFNRDTGAPISGNPGFLITDIDGSGGNPIESVSAQCSGLTSYTVNGDFVAGVNANSSNTAQSNIRITEANGAILAEGTQGQNGNQQEGYMQYNWTDVNSWTVSYFATTGGRWFVHDADSDIPFDGTRILVDLVDLATIKTPIFSVDPMLGSARPPRQGENITWTIELSNAGPANASNADITDNLPANVSLVSATSPFGNVALSNGNSTIDWSGVDVPVGASRVLTIVATVTGAAGETVSNQTNTAQADQSKCSARDVLQSSFIVDTPVASLSVDKTAGSPTTALGDIASLTDGGDTITYSYVVENTGNITLNDVVPVDPGPRFGNNAAPQGTLGGFSPTSVSLSPGDSQTFTAIYTLDQDDVDNVADGANPATGVNNTATATATIVDLSPTPTPSLSPVVPSTATTGFTVTPNAIISKSVTNAGSFGLAGDTIDYSVTIENTGNIELTQVRPRDDGPTINGAGRSGSMSAFTPNTVTLAPGESQVFTASYTLSQNDVNNVASSSDPLTSIDNQARLEAQSRLGSIQNVVSNTVETGFVNIPSMTIVKSVVNAGSFDGVGDPVNYQWLVTNTGNVSINNVQVSDSGPTFDGQTGTNTLQSISPGNANLAPGASQTFSATYTLSQQDVDNIAAAADPATAIDNTSQLTGTPVGGVFTPVDSNTVETGFVVAANLVLTKAVAAPTTGNGSDPSATDAGDQLAYSFTLQNTGNATASSLSLVDAGPTFNSIAGSGTFTLNACGATSLAPNQQTTCSATYILSAADVDNAVAGGANSVENSASASAENPNGTSVNSNTATASKTIVATSSIDLSKTAGTPTVADGSDGAITDSGDSVSYQLGLSNTGNTSLSSVNLSDSLATVICPALTDQGNSFTNGTGSLAAGDSITCSATYTLLPSDLNAGQVINTASVSSIDPSGAAINDSAMATVGFTQRTSIALTKMGGPEPSAETDFVVYSFNLENTGNVSLSNPQIVDDQTTGGRCTSPLATSASPLTFNSSVTNARGTFGYQSGDAGTVGVLDAGETWVFTCEYDVEQADIDNLEITNMASATGTPPTGLTAPNASASALVAAEQNTSINLTKVAGVPDASVTGLSTVVDEGDTVSYTFTVENTGNVTLSNIELSDPSIVPVAPNLISCPLTTLAPNVSMMCTASYALTQANIDAGEFNNVATVSGTPPVPPSGPALSTPTAMSAAMVSLPASPALNVVKTASTVDPNVSASDSITYTYVITNSGNVTIDGVLPIDNGPTFNGVSASNALGAFTPTTPATALPISLAPGASQTFEASYVLAQADIDNMAAAAAPQTAIDNTATATGAPVNGVLVGVTPSTVETGVVPISGVSLVKTSVAAGSNAGDLISYSFSLDNTGNVSISSPQVTDSQCALPGTSLTRTSGYVSGDTLDNGVLDVDETWLFNCTYPVTQADVDSGNVQNSATGGGNDPQGNSVVDTSGTLANNDTPTDTPLSAAPAWVITKSTASAPSRAGDTLVYSFELDNTGNVSISNVAVTDVKCASTPVLLSGDNDNNTVLDPSEVWLYSCNSIPVTQAEVDAGTVDNTVNAAGAPAGGLLLDASNGIQTTIAPVASIELVKSIITAGGFTAGFGANTTITDFGDSTTYRLTIRNTGTVTLSSLVINDPGPSFNSISGTGIMGAIQSCPASLAPGQVANCDYTYSLSQADIDNAIAGGEDAVVNTATVSATPPIGLDVVSAPSTATTTIANNASIAVEKTETGVAMNGVNGETIIGDTISYSITALNDGNALLSNVSIADTLAGVTVFCPPATNENGLLFTNGAGALPVGESVTCTASYPISQDDLNAGSVINQATASATDPAGASVSEIDEVTTPLTQSTSILLSKSATLPAVVSPPLVGQVIDYTFTLENTGNVSLNSPLVSDPNCVSPNAPSPVLVGGFITGDINQDGILDSGETFTFACSYTTDQDDFDAGGVTNVATGSATTPNGSGLPNPSSTASSLADLQQEGGISLIKRAGVPMPNTRPSEVGDTISYEFDVENTGNVSLDSITISDSTITDAPNNGTINCPVSTLAAGASTVCTATYTLTQTDIDAGSVMNDATVVGQPPATVPPTAPPSGMSSAMVGIVADPNLSIVKSVAPIPATIVAGDIISYSFTVENTGNVTIEDVSPIDSGVTFDGVLGTNSLSAFLPGPVTLAPGQNQIFTATYTVSQADLDLVAAADDKATAAINESETAIDNSATATGEPFNGLLPTIPSSAAETGITTSPEFSLIKTSIAPSPALAGSEIVYNFALENTGNVTISSPTIADAQCLSPAGTLSFTSGYVSGDAGVIGALDVGETWLFACRYTLSQADVDAGTVQNTATASGLEPGGDPVSDISDSANPGDDTGLAADPTNTPLVQTPSWLLTKSTQSTPSDAGDTLLYSFELDNTGNVSVSSIVVADSKCAAAPSLISGDTDNNNVLDPSEIWTYTCTSIPVTQAEVDAGFVDNSASANGVPAGGILAPSVANVRTPIASNPSWNVVKSTASVPTSAGDVLSYSFVVDNTGNVSISGIAIADAKCAAAPNLDSGDANGDLALNPNEVFTYSCLSIPVTQAEVDAGQALNSVILSGSPPSGSLANATDSIVTPIASAGSLSLAKTAAAPTIGFGNLSSATDAGDAIEYTFEVTNDGNVTIDNLLVNDLGQTFDGQAGTGTLGAITCPVTILAPSQATTCSATYTLSQADVDSAIAGGADSASNSATVSGEDPANNAVSSAGSTATTTVAAMPELTLVKTAAAPTIVDGANNTITDPGDSIGYTLDFENTGNTTISNVTLSDSIATVSCIGFNNGGDSLAPGATASCTAIYIIDQDDLNIGQVVNTANVAGQDPAGTQVVGTAQQTSGFTQRTSISLVKSGTPFPASPSIGDAVTYTFEVTNTGNVTLDPISVTDPLINAQAAPNDQISCPLTTLSSGQTTSCTATYELTGPDVANGEVSNTATAAGTPPVASGLDSPSSTSGTLLDVEQIAAISLVKVAGVPTLSGGSLNGVVDAGDTVSYTFEVSNTGNTQLDAISITDPLINSLPNNVQVACPFTSLNPSLAIPTVAPTQMSCTAIYTLTQANIDAGSLANTASIEATPLTTTSLPAVTAASSAMVTLDPTASLSIVKSASVIPNTVAENDSITYSYEVSNTGNVTINAVVPDDAGPTFNGASATNTLGAYSPLSADLAPGATQIFTADYVLAQADLDNMSAAANPNTSVDNTATATGTPLNGVLSAVTPSQVQTGVLPLSALSLIKTSVAPNPASPGASITYRFELTNSGNLTIINPTVSDAQCQAPGSVLSFASGYSSGDAAIVGELDVGETWVFNCSYAITQADIDAGTVQNTATAAGQDPSGATVSDTSDSNNAADAPGAGDDDPTNTPLVQQASWTVAKSTLSTPGEAGDTLLYSFIVDNTGNVSISNIALSDAKCATPPVLTSGDIDNNNILAPTEVWSYSCTSIGVTQAEVDAGRVDNNVSVSGAPPAGVLAPATDSVSTLIAAGPSLSLTKTAAAPTIGLGALAGSSDAGDTISYTFAVQNNGNVTIDNVLVNEQAPGVSFNGVAGTGSMTAITCPATTLAPSQVTNCSAVYTLSQEDIDNAIAGGVNAVSNTATTSGTDPNAVVTNSPSSTATTSIALASDIEIVKTSMPATSSGGADPTITDPSDTIVYNLAVTNTGNTSLTSITVSDTLATVDCTPFVNGTDSLAPGESLNCSAQVSLSQADINDGQVTNLASVSASDPSGGQVNDQSELITSINQKTSVSLSKTASVPSTTPPTVGEQIVYSFSLQNTGNVSLTNPSVSDPMCPATLSAGVGFISDNGGNGDTVLDASEVWSFSCNYTITQADVDNGDVANSAVGTGTPPASSGLPNPTSTASSLAVLQQETGISLDKTSSMPTIANGALSTASDVGDTISYTFNVANTGNVTLSSIVVSDPLIESAPNNGTIICGEASLVSAAAALADPSLSSSTTCTATYILTQADVDAGRVMNDAEVNADPPVTVPPTTPPSGTSSNTVPIAPAPNLEIIKSALPIPATIMAGDVISYSYLVENTGNVTINDVLPVDAAGPSFNGVSGSNSLSAFSVSAPASLPISLSPGEAQTFTASYAVSQADIDNMAAAAAPTTAVDNTATATGVPVIGTLPPIATSTVEIGVAGTPELELVKSSQAPALAVVGAIVDYQFILSNTGNVTITNPVISDAQCQNPGATLSFASGYDSGDSGQVASLDVGETWVYSCSYALTQADIDAGTVQNTATAVGQEPNGSSVSDVSDSNNAPDQPGAGDSDPTNTPLARSPSWTVVKATSSTPENVGDTLVYSFTVDNTGNTSISNVVVSDAKCSAAPSLISGDVDSNNVLTPNEVWTYSCTSIGVTQLEVDNGVVNNSVTVSGTPPTGTSLAPATNAIATPIVSNPAISIVKMASAPTVGLGVLTAASDPDDTITYSFVVSNDGNVSLNAITVNDDQPSFNGVAGTNALSAVSCPLTSLIPNQSTTCTATYILSQLDIDNAISAGVDSVENAATVSGTPAIGGTIESAPSTANTTIISSPAITVVKTAGAPTTTASIPGITDPGDSITYNLEITNTGNSSLDTIVVVDDIADSVICPASSLAPGASFSCNAIYTLVQGDFNTGSVTNEASVSGLDPFDTVVSDSDQINSGLTQNTSIALDKTIDVSGLTVVPGAIAGEIVVYNFALENTGNVSLTSPTVTDPKCGPAPLAFGSGFVSGDNGNAELDAGETWVFSCDYALTQTEIDNNLIDNTAVGAGVTPAGSGLANPSSTAGVAFTDIERTSQIRLEKIAGLPSDAAGVIPDATDAGDATNPADTITFSFEIQNTGTVTLSDIELTDPLITGSATTPIVCGATILAPTEIATCSATYDITQADLNAGMVSNTASVTATPPADVPAPSASSSAMVILPPEPALTVAKSVQTALSAPLAVGQQIVYSFELVNSGNVDIIDAVPIDVGPTFNGVAGEASLVGFVPVNASLVPGASQIFTASYAITQSDINRIGASADPATAVNNSATATGTPVNGTLATVTPNGATTGAAVNPSIALTKSATAPTIVAAGSLIEYEFSLFNDGNVSITNPSVSDALCQLPGSTLSFTSGYISGDGLTPEALDVGETWIFNCSYAITQDDIDLGSRQNQAEASGQQPNGNTITDDSDSGDSTNPDNGDDDPTITTLAPAPLWSVSKSTSSVPLNAGDTLVYNFAIENQGNVSIISAQVVDDKCAAPAVLDPSSDLGSDGEISPAGLNGVPAAEVWQYSCTSIPVLQAEVDAGQVINRVDISGTTSNGLLAPAFDQISTTVTRTPLMSLAKQASTSSINDDGSFNQLFSFELRNVGNVTLSNLSIIDDFVSQFGACFDLISDGGSLSINDVAPLADSGTTAAGTSPSIATASSLAVGDSLVVTDLSARFDPNAAGCTFPSPASNSASATADSSAGSISDVSDDLAAPSALAANDAGAPTDFVPPTPSPELGVAKSAVILSFNQDFTFDVEYTIRLQNTGDVDLNELELFDDIETQFGAAYVASAASNSTGGVLSAPAISLVTDTGDTATVLPSVDSDFSGDAANIITTTDGVLGVGDVIELSFSIRVDPTKIQPVPSQFENTAEARAKSPAGLEVSDLSDEGSDPSVGSGGATSPTIVRLDDVANLPIVLGKFMATAVGESRVIVSWTTQTEVSNIGFNLYGRLNGEWQQLNADVVPAKGDSVELVNYQIELNSLATKFALSDIDAQGKETLHGPFVLGTSYGAQSERQTTDWSHALERRKQKKAERELQMRKQMQERNRLRREQRKQRLRAGGQ